MSKGMGKTLGLGDRETLADFYESVVDVVFVGPGALLSFD